MKQLIFVVETNRECQSDKIYINFILKTLYIIDPLIKISWVLMDGNSKYRKDEVTRDIEDCISMNRSGSNEVIFVLDEDKTAKQKKKVNEIKVYCVKNNYKTILFNTSIEDVLLGQRISKKKQERAKAFVATNRINDLIWRLECINPRAGQSNVLAVLDNYLKRRKP